MKPIPYGRQCITEADADAVRLAIRQDFLTQGPTIEAFESEIKSRVLSGRATTVSSATAALHLAYSAMGLGAGKTLWTSPITFVSTANAARFCGASVDFVDVDSETGNLCPQRLLDKLKASAENKTLPSLVVPVHLGGSSCDMESIKDACDRYEVGVVEDASHALGGSYLGEPVGSCKFSDAAVFSFHPVKMITTGEGGCVTTNSDHLAAAVSQLRSHGITRDDDQLTNQSEGGWYYEQQRLGFNYRITDIQAALGLSQIKRLESFVETRNKIADAYHGCLPTEAVPVKPLTGVRSSYHLFMVLLLDAETRRKVYDHLHSQNIRVQVHYIPVHYHPYYQDLGFNRGDFPDAETFYDRVLSLPMFPQLTVAEIERVNTALAEALKS